MPSIQHFVHGASEHVDACTTVMAGMVLLAIVRTTSCMHSAHIQSHVSAAAVSKVVGQGSLLLMCSCLFVYVIPPLLRVASLWVLTKLYATTINCTCFDMQVLVSW